MEMESTVTSFKEIFLNSMAMKGGSIKLCFQSNRLLGPEMNLESQK
jgi:hypothetical protein